METKDKTIILFLSGINYENVKTVEDNFENDIITEINIQASVVEYNKISKYETLPCTFTSLAEWPNTTDFNCWSCYLSVKNIPVFIPTVINGNMKMKVFGIFCSFNCAQLYINTHYDDKLKIIEYSSNLNLLYKAMTGKKILQIEPSFNPLFELKKFGGELTQEEYNKKQKTILLIHY